VITHPDITRAIAQQRHAALEHQARDARRVRQFLRAYKAAAGPRPK
jgi:hypothetical protein